MFTQGGAKNSLLHRVAPNLVPVKIRLQRVAPKIICLHRMAPNHSAGNFCTGWRQGENIHTGWRQQYYGYTGWRLTIVQGIFFYREAPRRICSHRVAPRILCYTGWRLTVVKGGASEETFTQGGAKDYIFTQDGA